MTIGYHRAMSGSGRGRSPARVIAALALVSISPAATADSVPDEPTEPTVSQRQAMYAKPSVVRIYGVWEGQFRIVDQTFTEFIGGSGSGFFISADGFIATNAHVVDKIHDGEEKAKEQLRLRLFEDLKARYGAELARMTDAELDRLIASIELVKIVPHAEVVLPDGTRKPYEIKAYGSPVGEGSSKDCAIIKIDIENAPTLPIGDSEKVKIQDHMLAIGYPGVADLEGLLDEKSQLEASITDGSVSAIKRTNEGDPVIQITAPISHGNSGGPAVNDKGDVIGLVTFGDAKEVQGFNFLVSSSTLKKFVKESKANTKQSETSVIWRRALDEFWSRKYDKAIVDFEEVMTLYPPHSEATRFLQDARQLKKAGKGASSSSSSGGSSTGIVIGLFVFAAVAGVLAVVFIKRSKKPAQPPRPGMGAHGAAVGMHPHPYPGPPGPPPPGPPPFDSPGLRPGLAQDPRVPGPAGSYPPPMMSPPGAYPPPPGMPMGGTGPLGALGTPASYPPGASGPPGVVAKTIAINAPGTGHPPVAATAFGSFTVGTLTCTRGLLSGQRFSLTPQGLLIGRQPGLAQVVVNDSRASGKHVWIGYENGSLVVVDQGTTNGTFVNDVRHGRVSKAQLKDGDIVIVAEPDVLSLQVKLS
jgi:serine protease Do